MRCPNCGNEIYELIDYAIARCTNCYSLWDPYIYPGFPTPDVEVGEIWDTTEQGNSLVDDETDQDEFNEYGNNDDEELDVDESDDWDTDQEEDNEFEDDSDDWNDENGDEQEEDY